MVKEGSFSPLGDWAERVREFAVNCDRKAEVYCQNIHRQARNRGTKADAHLRDVVQISNRAWQEMRPGLGRAVQEIRKAFHDARDSFKQDR